MAQEAASKAAPAGALAAHFGARGAILLATFR